jgi:hypothetical protein
MNFNTNKYYNTRYSETKYTSIQNTTSTNTNTTNTNTISSTKTKKSNVLDESEFPPLKKAQVNENSTLINESYTKNNTSTILNFLEAAKKVYNSEEYQDQDQEHEQSQDAADEMNVVILNEDAFRRHYDEDSD